MALSAIVALSLTPMLASRLLRGSDDGRAHRTPVFLQGLGAALSRLFRFCLNVSLDFPLAVFLIAVIIGAAALFEFGSLKQQLTPSEDRASISLNLTAPPTASLDFTQTQLLKIEALLQPIRDRGDIQSIFSISGFGNSSRGRMPVTLSPWDQRSASQADITAEIRMLLQKVQGVKVNLQSANSLGIRGGGNGLQFAVVGNDYAALGKAAQAIADEMSKNPQLADVAVKYDTTQPQLTLTVDQSAATALGIPIAGLSSTLQAMINGTPVTNVFVNGTSYPVIMVSTKHPVNNPQDLDSVYVRAGDGRYLPMSSIASLKEAPIPPSLERDQHRRAVSVSASLSEQLPLGDAFAIVRELAQPILAPDQAIIPLAEAQTITDNNTGLATTFGFAVLIVVLVRAAQFEGFLSALIVMMTVPFGLACAIFAIKFGGGTLNIYSEIGLILVVGIMAKNGILIVDLPISFAIGEWLCAMRSRRRR